MANKTAKAVHTIYLGGFKGPIAAGDEFEADAEIIDELIADGAAAAVDSKADTKKAAGGKPAADGNGGAPAGNAAP